MKRVVINQLNFNNAHILLTVKLIQEIVLVLTHHMEKPWKDENFERDQRREYYILLPQKKKLFGQKSTNLVVFQSIISSLIQTTVVCKTEYDTSCARLTKLNG